MWMEDAIWHKIVNVRTLTHTHSCSRASIIRHRCSALRRYSLLFFFIFWVFCVFCFQAVKFHFVCILEIYTKLQIGVHQSKRAMNWYRCVGYRMCTLNTHSHHSFTSCASHTIWEISTRNWNRKKYRWTTLCHLLLYFFQRFSMLRGWFGAYFFLFFSFSSCRRRQIIFFFVFCFVGRI